MATGSSDSAPTALFIRHDPDAHPGHVGRRLGERGFRIEELPVAPSHEQANPVVDFGDPGRWDAIVALGSVWSVYDQDRIGNWIGAELDFLAEAHRRDIPILGICFGGQALAAALGGVVEPAPRPEVGWHRVESDKPDVVAPGPWMQWHFDRFSVPEGAAELARSDSGPQAFVAGRSLGVQFHPEVTADIVLGWLAGAPPEDLDRPEVDVAAIRVDTAANHEPAGRACERLIDWFVDSVAEIG
jgi:GMP synthase-like glutamine amidotransferase